MAVILSRVKIRAGNVTLTIYPWKHPSGREYHRFDFTCPETGRVKSVTRSALAKAKEAARSKCIELSSGQLSLDTLPATTIARLRRLLEHDATLSFAEEYLAQLKTARPRKPLAEALEEFLQTKEANRGASTSNIDQLTRNLKKFPDHCGSISMAEIPPSIIEAYIIGNGARAPRYRQNIRRSLISFFRWCRARDYLPETSITAAEKTEKPIITKKIPTTYTPDELKIILTQCQPEHRLWFSLQAWAGIRGDELLSPSPDKSPLQWTDIDLEKNIITIRPETAKTKTKRVIPICPALKDALKQAAEKTGRVAIDDPRKYTNGHSETKRLGELLGGWKQNALRHSYISYRAAIIGLGRTAMEAGNSENEAKRSYNDAMTEAQANEWFTDQSQNTTKDSL